MCIQIVILALLCSFYIIYFAKTIMLKKQGISVDLLGKGDKTKRAARVEIVLKAITYTGAAVQFVTALLPTLIWSFSVPLPVQITGAILAAIGVTFFAISVTTMRNNWRAGFDKKQDTSLVTSGIYKVSRNPAFVGFDLLYIGCALSFPSIAMIVIAVMAIIALHVQILGEERFLTENFGQEYSDYKSKVRRYL